MPSHHEDTQDHATDGLRPISDVLDEVMQRLERDRSRPLAKLQERLPDGRIAVEIFDRERGDQPHYDFYCRDPRQALEFVRQLAGKQWVTKRHLEVFASLMLHAFPEGQEARS